MQKLFKLLFISIAVLNVSSLALEETELSSDLNSVKLEVQRLKEEAGQASDGVKNYRQINKIWRKMVDSSPNVFSIESEKEQKATEENMITLLEAGKVRSLYLRKIYTGPGSKGLSWDLDYFQDIKREISLVPKKWYAIVYFRLIKIKKNLTGGFQGIKELIGDIFTLFLILLIPLISWGIIKKIVVYLKEQQVKYVRENYRKPKYGLLISVLKFLITYLPWIIVLWALSVVRRLLLQTELAELSLFVPFFSFFIYYKIATKFIVENLLKISREKTFKVKAQKTAKRIASTILISITLLYIIESVAGKGISYYLVKTAAIYLVFAFVLFYTSNWREELSERFAGYGWGKTSDWISKALLKKRWTILCLPAIVFIFIYNTLIRVWKWSERFDIVKKISAKIFKKKLENSEMFESQSLEQLPTEYYDLFDKPISEDETLFISPETEDLKTIQTEIEEWISDSAEENSVALVGDKGSGKSTILNVLENNLKEIRVLKMEMDSRILTSADLFKVIGELFQVEMSESLAPLIKHQENMPKTVVIIDNAQNTFLSQMGGFKAFKGLLELVNMRTNNIFWCMSFNLHSWNYLNSVFGKNQTFRIVHYLKPWKEADIEKLILRRHALSDFKLSYKEILWATRGELNHSNIKEARDQFFRLLWEQSLGNPQVSLYMWRSALKYRGGKQLNVGLPHDDDVMGLDKISEDALFVYTAIVKHEKLSVKNAVKITSLEEGTVRYAVKYGLDQKFLNRTTNRLYSLDIRFQHSILTYLKKKNLIHGR